jgi:hypothetical protein
MASQASPPSADRKARREQARPGGAKPGHEGHSRALGPEADRVVDHAPPQCPCSRVAVSPNLPREEVSVHERIELPKAKSFVEHHRRLSVQCPGCGARVVAAPPPAATGTPFGPRLHALATYLKAFQSLSYERLQATLADLFGPSISQGGRQGLSPTATATATRHRPQVESPSPLAPPDPFHPLGVHLPARIAQQGCHLSVAVAAVSPRQFDDVRRQPLLVLSAPRRLALRWVGSSRS